MDSLDLTEEEYFSYPKEERYEISKKVLNLMKTDGEILLPEMFDEIIIPRLKLQLEDALNNEEYMICESIKFMLMELEK